jgi:hypothetical protein
MNKITLALEWAQKKLERDPKARDGFSGEDLALATMKLAVDIKRRDRATQRFEGERRPLAHELSMADDVLELWRHHLIGNRRDRDWKILMALAAGGSSRNVGPEFSISHVWASKIRQLQCHHIWLNVARFMPNVDPVAMAFKLGESIAAESLKNGE